MPRSPMLGVPRCVITTRDAVIEWVVQGITGGDWEQVATAGQLALNPGVEEQSGRIRR